MVKVINIGVLLRWLLFSTMHTGNQLLALPHHHSENFLYFLVWSCSLGEVVWKVEVWKVEVQMASQSPTCAIRELIVSIVLWIWILTLILFLKTNSSLGNKLCNIYLLNCVYFIFAKILSHSYGSAFDLHHNKLRYCFSLFFYSTHCYPFISLSFSSHVLTTGLMFFVLVSFLSNLPRVDQWNVFQGDLK